MSRIFITGDKHGNFSFLKDFCRKAETTIEDYLIILGDCGINFFLNDKDLKIKKEISECPITLICVHGNHEERPCNILSYIKEFNYQIQCGVWYEKQFPNILFPSDGEMIIDNKTFLVLGGAYSVDKPRRIMTGDIWYPSEQMSDETKDRILRFISTEKQFDFVLSHTCPLTFEPKHLLCNFVDQSKVDKSMEQFLDIVLKQIDFDGWFFGHYHSDEWIVPGVRILYRDIIELTSRLCDGLSRTQAEQSNNG